MIRRPHDGNIAIMPFAFKICADVAAKCHRIAFPELWAELTTPPPHGPAPAQALRHLAQHRTAAFPDLALHGRTHFEKVTVNYELSPFAALQHSVA